MQAAADRWQNQKRLFNPLNRVKQPFLLRFFAVCMIIICSLRGKLQCGRFNCQGLQAVGQKILYV
jgi:hypothetical protein